MLVTLSAVLALFAAGQAPSVSMSTVVNLCNETPATVAFMVSRPAGRGLHTQRGWFNAEPGACAAGAIGTGRAGEALIHAMSGTFTWPAAGGLSQCVAEGGMDRLAATPPCAEGERAAPVRAVPVIERGRSYLIEHTVRCRDLAADDAALCEQGLRGPDGFAALVRTLEVCNTGRVPLRAAGAGEAGAPGAWRIEGWTSLEAGACAQVWRGQSRSGSAYVRVEAGGESPWAEAGAAFCVPDAADFVSPPARPGAGDCAPGERNAGFREVMYGPNVSHFQLEYSID